MRISEAGITLIKSFESFKAQAYLCPSDKLTIGYGHTGPDVKPGMVITEPEGVQLLQMDLRTAETDAFRRWGHLNLKQHQFDVFTSFCFNFGVKSRKQLQQHPLERVPYVLPRYNQNNKGVVQNGLIRRRQAEGLLFLGDLTGMQMLLVSRKPLPASTYEAMLQLASTAKAPLTM